MIISSTKTREVLAASLLVIPMISFYFHEIKSPISYLHYIVGLLLLVMEFSEFGVNKRMFTFLLGVIAIYIVDFLIVGNGNLFLPFKMILQSVPLAFFFLKQQKLNKKIWYVTAGVIFIIVESAWIKSPDKYLLFNDVSRNYISILLLLSVFILTVVRERNREQVPIGVPLLYMLACVLGVGRGGIISGFLYLSLIVLYRVFKNPNERCRKIKIILVILLMVGLLVTAIIYENILIDKFLAKFVNGAVEKSNLGRMRIYMMYLESAISSIKNFLFGVDTSEIGNMLNFVIGNNLHSSYLQLHSLFGILGLILFIKYIIKAFCYLKRKSLYQSFICLFVYLIRIASDYAICGYITDVILFYYILMPFVKKGENGEG